LYQKFFGFQRHPFELVPDPDFLYLGESHEAALANLVLGIESGRGVVAISGKVGTGKTTILRALVRRLGRQQPICYLSQPEFETADLLRAVLDGFGLISHGLDKIDLRRKISDFLLARPRAGVLIVDEAHLLSEEALEQIRLLSNLEEDRRKLLQIILAGQPELKELLSSPRLRPLAQRIEMYYEIHPLAREETFAYIERRLRIAGSPGGLRFEPKAIESIHRHAGGIPRLINVLADRCLITAYVAETQHITEKIVREAYDDLGDVAHAVMPGDGAPPPAGSGSRPRRPTDPRDAPTRGRKPPRDTRPDGESGRDRWFAAVGIAAVALLALMSLGGRGLPALVLPHATQAKAAAPAPPVESPYSGVGSGVAWKPTDAAAEAAPVETPAAPDLYTIHVASFREAEHANELATGLRAETSEPVRVSAVTVETGSWYRVLLGEFASEEAALDRIALLRQTREDTYMRPIRLVHPEHEGRVAETPSAE
jgi:type II secretory pathway predicted ATPase ExeA